MTTLAGVTRVVEGGRLARDLVDLGHDVVCLARDPSTFDGVPWSEHATIVRGDALDRATLDAAMVGVDTVYYLVHSMAPRSRQRVRSSGGSEPGGSCGRRAPARRPARSPTARRSRERDYRRFVIERIGKNLRLASTAAPAESQQLEADGWAVLHGVLTSDEIAELVDEAERVFREYEPARGRRDRDEFRYQMLNISEPAHRAIAHPRILEVIEPLLGDDCHVVANTLWNNPPEFGGGPWHCDAGPHVPRPPDVPWDDRIPYPVFAIGAHILLKPCTTADGPTAVVPGSHRSGRLAPFDRLTDPDLTYDGRPPVLLDGDAGDVALFVSDAWHRGTPATGGTGRLFLQAHYGRRDIAQRIRTTDEINHLSPEAIAWADTPRRRELVGLHDPYFYDG